MSLIPISLSMVCILSGLCGVVGAVLDWDFYGNEHARNWMKQFGRSGTRVMIGFVGAITLLVGVLGAVWTLLS